MPQPTLGRLEAVNLRKLWEHEERDFTPWLAQNIDQLSELLGIRIVVEQIEKSVGRASPAELTLNQQLKQKIFCDNFFLYCLPARERQAHESDVLQYLGPRPGS